MMNAMNSFLCDYPLSLKEALLVPCLEALVLQSFGQDVCWPSQAGLEHFVGCFGHSQAAFRTALSRAKKQAEIIAFKDAEGVKRIEPSAILKTYTRYFLAETFVECTFSLLLFHFSTHENKQRYALKELLANLNYVMLTQNAYLRCGNDPEQIDALLDRHGFTENVYHFSDVKQIPARLEQCIAVLYQTDIWAALLKDYQTQFEAYLQADPSDTAEAYLRYLYTRAAFHKNIMSRAPSLPIAYFPESQITQSIFDALQKHTQTHLAAHAGFFRQVFA